MNSARSKPPYHSGILQIPVERQKMVKTHAEFAKIRAVLVLLVIGIVDTIVDRSVHRRCNRKFSSSSNEEVFGVANQTRQQTTTTLKERIVARHRQSI